MEARNHPRTRLSVPVGLYCTEKSTYYRRKINNISVGGLYVDGNPCGRKGAQLEVIINPAVSELESADRYTGEILRSCVSGFAMQFRYLDENQQRKMEELIWPKWDGEDMLEGLLIVAPREDVVDLADWMRLTSIVSRHYKRICSKRRLV